MSDDGSQVVIQALQRKFTNLVRSDVDKAVATVERKMLDATLTAMDNLVNPKVEVAIG